MRSGRVLASFLALITLVSGCESGDAQQPDTLIQTSWQEVSLPLPQGVTGRIMVRESVQCAGRWYIVGAVLPPGEETRPVVWSSPDGNQWQTVPMNPKTYYGERSILYSAGCKDGKIAVIGSKTGGAHGNPRVSTWYQGADGSLTEVVSHFELYNGPNYMNVARMVPGPSSWLIVGNRTPGSAVWLSPDATEFTIVEGAPELASDARGETWAADGVYANSGWLVVGGFLPKGRIDRDPMAWTSPDGKTWQRTVIAGTDGYEELQRVLVRSGEIWSAGLDGKSFGAWRLNGASWEKTGAFSSLGGSAAPSVKSLAPAAGGLLVAGATGHDHEVWGSPDGRKWRKVQLPSATPVGAERTISINGSDQRSLLLIDDGEHGKAWFGAVSVTF